jgi:hypothetical protein
MDGGKLTSLQSSQGLGVVPIALPGDAPLWESSVNNGVTSQCLLVQLVLLVSVASPTRTSRTTRSTSTLSGTSFLLKATRINVVLILLTPEPVPSVEFKASEFS